MVVFLAILSLVAGVWMWLLLSRTYRRSLEQRLNADTPVSAVEGREWRWPAVTAIVPARNEADVLPTTIPTLCNQSYPDLRVILVDDQSEDDSAAVMEELRSIYGNLTVVQGTARPAGWYGKQWAVKQGVDLARSGYLLFTDADIVYHPQAIQQAVRFMLAHDLEMISLLPQMIFGTTGERLAVTGAMAVIAALFPLALANDPKSKLALAAGGFILIRREAYDRVGGHEAVKDQMIEDVSLARRLKAAGVRMQVRFTQDLLHTRMYAGWADLWEGLAKNAYAGVDYSIWKFLAGVVGGMLIGILPPVYLIFSIMLLVPSGTALAWAAFVLALLINLCMVVVHSRIVRHFRLRWWHSLMLPISGLLYMLAVIWSVYQHHFTRGTVWKGRHYGKEVGRGTGSEVSASG